MGSINISEEKIIIKYPDGIKLVFENSKNPNLTKGTEYILLDGVIYILKTS